MDDIWIFGPKGWELFSGMKVANWGTKPGTYCVIAHMSYIELRTHDGRYIKSSTFYIENRESV